MGNARVRAPPLSLQSRHHINYGSFPIYGPRGAKRGFSFFFSFFSPLFSREVTFCASSPSSPSSPSSSSSFPSRPKQPFLRRGKKKERGKEWGGGRSLQKREEEGIGSKSGFNLPLLCRKEYFSCGKMASACEAASSPDKEGGEIWIKHIHNFFFINRARDSGKSAHFDPKKYSLRINKVCESGPLIAQRCQTHAVYVGLNKSGQGWPDGRISKKGHIYVKKAHNKKSLKTRILGFYCIINKKIPGKLAQKKPKNYFGPKK